MVALNSAISGGFPKAWNPLFFMIARPVAETAASARMMIVIMIFLFIELFIKTVVMPLGDKRYGNERTVGVLNLTLKSVQNIVALAN